MCMPACVYTPGTKLESFPIFIPNVSAIDRNTDLFGGLFMSFNLTISFGRGCIVLSVSWRF